MGAAPEILLPSQGGVGGLPRELLPQMMMEWLVLPLPPPSPWLFPPSPFCILLFSCISILAGQGGKSCCLDSLKFHSICEREGRRGRPSRSAEARGRVSPLKYLSYLCHLSSTRRSLPPFFFSSFSPCVSGEAQTLRLGTTGA